MTQTPNAGSSSDQIVTGGPETDKFPTDNPPGSDTPASGSSNKGINDNRSNLNEGEDDLAPEPPD